MCIRHIIPHSIEVDVDNVPAIILIEKTIDVKLCINPRQFFSQVFLRLLRPLLVTEHTAKLSLSIQLQTTIELPTNGSRLCVSEGYLDT